MDKNYGFYAFMFIYFKDTTMFTFWLNWWAVCKCKETKAHMYILSDEKPPPTPLLVTLRSIAKETEFIMATSEIYVGCVRTMAVSQKKVSNDIIQMLL